MTDLRDILISGKAGNKDLNAETGDAKAMQTYFSGIVKGTTADVHELVINTTVNSAQPSELIPITDVEPEPEDGMEFFYHLRVSSPVNRDLLWCVSSFLTAIEVRGLEVATRDYLKELDPALDYVAVPYTYEAIEESLNALYTDAKSVDES